MEMNAKEEHKCRQSETENANQSKIAFLPGNHVVKWQLWCHYGGMAWQNFRQLL
jgi:hypothetical protein